jgi:D-alanine-D-alanine ligase-like ATP-grasp enzyme
LSQIGQLASTSRGRIQDRPEADIVFLEANPNPALGIEDDVAESTRRAGLTYPQLIERIVQQACRRKV